MKSSTLHIVYLLIVLFTGCIYEDLSDCPVPSNVTLHFQYTGDGENDIFRSRINNVYLHLFNEKDELMRIQEFPEWQLREKQGVDLLLDEGTYKVVCWGNVFQNTSIRSTDDNSALSSYFVFNSGLLNGDKVFTDDSLYFGTHTLHVTENVRKTDTILFSSAHINMQIYVEGWTTTGQTPDVAPSIEIENLFSMYDFEMVTTDGQISYYPVVEQETDKGTLYSSATTVKRFTEENDVLVHIRNREEETLFTLELAEFIRKNNIRIKGIQEVNIPIYIKFQGINVSVSVAEWDSEGNIKPSL